MYVNVAWNIWGHIQMVPACINGVLTIVQTHWNAMLQTQDMTLHTVSVHRHGAKLLSFDVKRHTGSHNYPFECLWCDLTMKSLSYPSTQEALSYPRYPNFCSEDMVDWLCKIRIYIQCSYLIAPLRGYMKCEESWCSLQTLEGRLSFGYYMALFNITSHVLTQWSITA